MRESHLVPCRKLEKPGPQAVRPNTGCVPEGARSGVKTALGLARDCQTRHERLSLARKRDCYEAASIDDGESSELKRLRQRSQKNVDLRERTGSVESEPGARGEEVKSSSCREAVDRLHSRTEMPVQAPGRRGEEPGGTGAPASACALPPPAEMCPVFTTWPSRRELRWPVAPGPRGNLQPTRQPRS